MQAKLTSVSEQNRALTEAKKEVNKKKKFPLHSAKNTEFYIRGIYHQTDINAYFNKNRQLTKSLGSESLKS